MLEPTRIGGFQHSFSLRRASSEAVELLAGIVRETKTKPTQHSAASRLGGIQSDAIVCRAEREVPVELKWNIALMRDVDEEAVISRADATPSAVRGAHRGGAGLTFAARRTLTA